jgi:hypothetical protein
VPRHFLVTETHDAEFLAGDLFRRVFGQPIPDYPSHFVCLHGADDGTLRTAGYVHFSAFESVHLVGGFVVEREIYRGAARAHLGELRPSRSIGEHLMREAIGALPASNAVFAFMGDRRSIEVNERVGYERTHLPNLYAFWRRELTEDEKRAIAERVLRVTPF